VALEIVVEIEIEIEIEQAVAWTPDSGSDFDLRLLELRVVPLGLIHLCR
jgi:hypothetical protein